MRQNIISSNLRGIMLRCETHLHLWSEDYHALTEHKDLEILKLWSSEKK
jgi:hypothetical protein